MQCAGRSRACRRHGLISPPSGTITFLFTDIEGSTRLWENHTRPMKAALARHDVILRSCIEAFGGYVFKTVGDAFCAAFETAADGMQAALESQNYRISGRSFDVQTLREDGQTDVLWLDVYRWPPGDPRTGG